MELKNVFPPDDEFDSERDFHAHHFFPAESCKLEYFSIYSFYF